ncbi:hypothetical protein FA95DRAFT_1558199 [Auriscalpium vulgare]|uniref:Uncharacterized protein n=1 Tax=Auriscalpium vulgare TaxID=40419 RepID=A0ACB8RXP1_9AGAM|nr:hypothetical protein FA95DRAFT_1558199 [Auriscalpium vulgare]
MTVQSSDCDQTLGSSNSANPARDIPCGSPALSSLESQATHGVPPSPRASWLMSRRRRVR